MPAPADRARFFICRLSPPILHFFQIGTGTSTMFHPFLEPIKMAVSSNFSPSEQTSTLKMVVLIPFLTLR